MRNFCKKNKPRIFIAVPNMGVIAAGLTRNLIRWTANSRYEVDEPFLLSNVQPLDSARNLCIRKFRQTANEWLWYIDSDIVPPLRTIELVKYNKDIISALCLIIKRDIEGYAFPYPCGVKLAKDGRYTAYYGKGLEEVDAVGGGCLFLSRKVVEAMGESFEVQHVSPIEILDQDFRYCKLAKQKGFKVWVHYDYLCSHFKMQDIKEWNRLLVRVQSKKADNG